MPASTIVPNSSRDDICFIFASLVSLVEVDMIADFPPLRKGCGGADRQLSRCADHVVKPTEHFRRCDPLQALDDFARVFGALLTLDLGVGDVDCEFSVSWGQ